MFKYPYLWYISFCEITTFNYWTSKEVITISSTINYEQLITEIGKCCLGEEECGECQKEECLIGYCKSCLLEALKQKDRFIDDGADNIPYWDTKIYDNEVLIEAIGFLLNQCRNCNLYHDEDCIINIVRECLEIILFGDSQEYRGSTFMYLNDIKSIDSHIADRIFESFNRRKE
ncbi:MAG: hypothetical protein WAO47_02170 [Caldicoprobacterales bacterium]